MKANFKTILVFALIVITLCFVLPFVIGNQSTTVKIENYSELLEKFSDEKEAVTYLMINTDGQVYLETHPLVVGSDGETTVNKDAAQAPRATTIRGRFRNANPSPIAVPAMAEGRESVE